MGRAGKVGAGAGDGGYTLLELVLVLLITGMLAGAFLTGFGEFYRQQELKDTAAALKRLARTASRSSAVWNVDFRLHFEDRRFILEPAAGPRPEWTWECPSSVRWEVQSRGAAGWEVPASFDWVFPGLGVAEPLAVRLTGLDGAFVEMAFNPLTGAVEQERGYFP